MKGIKYIIKPEDGVVVGIYETNVYREAELLRIRSNGPDYMTYHGFLEDSLREILTNNNGSYFQIKAIAKCSHDDVFDAEYGKKLVAARIDYKYHKMMLSAVDYITKKLQKAEKAMLRGDFIHCEKMKSIKKDLNEYFKVTR